MRNVVLGFLAGWLLVRFFGMPVLYVCIFAGIVSLIISFIYLRKEKYVTRISRQEILTWHQAVEFPATLNSEKHQGFSDWYFPKRKELRSVLESHGRFGYFWTASSKIANAWIIGIRASEDEQYEEHLANKNRLSLVVCLRKERIA